jgi:hypothetical protein
LCVFFRRLFRFGRGAGCSEFRRNAGFTLADEIRIFEANQLIAVHPVLEGRHQRRLAPGHRKVPTQRATAEAAAMPIGRAGDVVARRSLDFYDAVARRLAAEGRQP